MTAITRIQKSGATVLFVSHDVESIKNLCSRAVFLDRGEVQFVGKASEVTTMYVKRMREEMSNQAIKQGTLIEDITQGLVSRNIGTASVPIQPFKISAEFEEKVRPFRYGNGKAKVHFVELLDEENAPVLGVEFGQKVKLKIYFECIENVILSPNFYIQDEKKNMIFGGGPRTYGAELLEVEAGCRYVSTYTFEILLREGNYSIQIQLSSPVILDESAEFLDVLENAVVYKVSRRAGSRLWTKIFVPADFETEKYS